MGGRPRRRAILFELERRLREREALGDVVEGGLLGLVVEWVAEGKTLTALCSEISRGHEALGEIGTTTLRAAVAASIPGDATDAEKGRIYDSALSEARRASAPAHVDKGLDLLDTADTTREALAKSKQQADFRRWLASKYDRKTYGDDAKLSLNVNIESMHVDSLRRISNPTQLAEMRAQLVGGDAVTLEALELETLEDAAQDASLPSGQVGAGA